MNLGYDSDMNLEERIAAIEERNKRVEAHKAWEVSLCRRGFIALITYITIAAFLTLIETAYPFLEALVPATGYLFSTWSLPWVKRWWMSKR
jgi:hypothetical protein